MQIHEITKRKLNEAGFAAGLATGLGSALSKVGVAGPAMEPSKFTGPAMDRSQAYAAAVQQAKTLKPLMQKSWAQAVQKIMSTSKDSAGIPITSLNQLNPAEMTNLQMALDTIINNNIGTQFTKLPNQTSDPQAKAGAQKIVQAIVAARDAILMAAKDGTDSAAAWEDLMIDGVAPAMNFAAYDAGGSGDVDIRAKRGDPNTLEISLGDGRYVAYDSNNPEHAEVAKQLFGGKQPGAAA